MPAPSRCHKPAALTPDLFAEICPLSGYPIVVSHALAALSRPAMPITETYPQLVRTVDDIRRQWRGQKVLGGICCTVAAAAGAILVTVALDNWLRPETTGRGLLAAGLWLSLAAAVLHWIVRRCIENRRDDYFAAMVEEKH